MRLPYSNLISPNIVSNWFQPWSATPLFTNPADGFVDFTIEEKFPALSLITSPFEAEWNEFSSWSLYLRENWKTPIIVSLLYLAGLVIGQKLMSKRTAFDLKYPLFLWNSLLAVFSIVGVIRVVPSLLYGLASNGPMYYMCRNASVGYGRGPLGFWSVLFVLSKYAELIDTLFLVLRKKPVPFLHWFHHFTVLLISIGTIMVFGPTGIVMIGMNFFVHSIMYSYYAIAAITRPPKWGQLVTVLQIAQMVIGLAMTGGIAYGALTVPNCDVNMGNALGIAFIYSSYLFLFLRFYWHRYTKRPIKDNIKKSE